ncbi:hypothetical protein ACFCZR_24350 [Streptomyces rubiginosohelvolus]|uniref:hypothetical protein n=1 Tax=Streptomyces rubiginosohelvolus TaxID=67362 RepID=UPI0035DB4CCE
MTTMTRPTTLTNPAVVLAAKVAALLPERAGTPWTVTPGTAWWSTRPTARLTQGVRTLVLVAHTWRTDVAWELPDRQPYEPDVRLDRFAPQPIADAVLRLVLPVLDDEIAGRATRPAPGTAPRLALLGEIGHAVRMQGLATHDRAGYLVNTSTLTWGTPSGLRYSVTVHGENPACHVQIQGPVRVLERAVGHLFPAPPTETPRRPLEGVRGRLQRRLAAHLAQFTDVEQLDDGGLAFGAGTAGARGPYGYAAPAADPAARVRHESPAAVDVHGVGADLLISLAPHLTR